MNELAKRAEADSEIGDEIAFVAAAHASSHAPGKELRILFDVRDQFEQLVGPVGHDLAFRVRGHQPGTASLAWRAMRNEAKSASA